FASTTRRSPAHRDASCAVTMVDSSGDWTFPAIAAGRLGFRAKLAVETDCRSCIDASVRRRSCRATAGNAGPSHRCAASRPDRRDDPGVTSACEKETDFVEGPGWRARGNAFAAQLRALPD